MERIYVDFNAREVLPGKQSVAIALSEEEVRLGYGTFALGERVVLYDEETECEAILRVGSHFPLVADIIPETIKNGLDES